MRRVWLSRAAWPSRGASSMPRSARRATCSKWLRRESIQPPWETALRWMPRALRASALLALLLVLARPASAQVQGPIYIIQPGDNLTVIAARFGTRLDELMAVNGFDLAHVLQPGERIIIPGLEGIGGGPPTHTGAVGGDLTALSLRLGLSPE